MEYTAGRGTTALGIIGTALGGLAVAGAPLLGVAAQASAPGRVAVGAGGSSDDQPVSRYEANQAARIAELETEVKLRDANTYTDSKLLDVYKYFDGRLSVINDKLCAQETWNATQTATLGCMAQQIAALNGMTKLVIPKTSICPEPMDRYNSFELPTGTKDGSAT